MPENDMIYVNGIDAATGEYLVAPMTYGQVASYVKGERHDTPLMRFFKTIWRTISQPHLGLPAGRHADDVTQAGWGVVFHHEEDPEVKKELQRLVEHRRKQVGDDKIVKVLEYDGEQDARNWLASHRVGAGSVIPSRVPFYLLLVGSPERIPFSFGHLLDVEYAVGRLHFDKPAQYAQYVDSLIAYEKGEAAPRAKEAVFIATRHKFDRATQLSADLLVDPLANGVPAQHDEPAQPGVAASQGFQTREIREKAATRDALTGVLAPPAGTTPPAFLFTATHGAGYLEPRDDQEAMHGALVCQDWSGIGQFAEKDYFAAKDLAATSGVQVHGLIAFLFACYSAGTPSHDRFIHKPGQPPPQIAAKPFLAALPKALLCHPQGGTLACIGHVERAWGYGFTTTKTGPQIQPFQNAITWILEGKPVGYAMKDFNERYAALNSYQSELLEEMSFGRQIPDEELATNWAWRNDAGGYVIIGDPAVRLRVDDLV